MAREKRKIQGQDCTSGIYSRSESKSKRKEGGSCRKKKRNSFTTLHFTRSGKIYELNERVRTFPFLPLPFLTTATYLLLHFFSFSFPFPSRPVRVHMIQSASQKIRKFHSLFFFFFFPFLFFFSLFAIKLHLSEKTDDNCAPKGNSIGETSKEKVLNRKNGILRQRNRKKNKKKNDIYISRQKIELQLTTFA